MYVLFHLSLCREEIVEEVKEPVDPAVRAKENWLRLFNKVQQQLQEVGFLLPLLAQSRLIIVTGNAGSRGVSEIVHYRQCTEI